MSGPAIRNYANSYEWMASLRSGFTPLIVACAVNGGMQGKEAHPSIPETPEEIAQQAREAYDAGASIVHVHGRSPRNRAEYTEDPDVYLEINRLIREHCPDIIINNTTGGGLTMTMEARYRCLEALPEMASLNMGPEMVRLPIAERRAPLEHPHDSYVLDACIPFTYGIVEALAGIMLSRDIKPEMELYHQGQYWVSRDLIDKGLVKPPYVFQFVMGYQTSIFPTPENVCAMLHELPSDSVYFVAGIGPFQLPLTTLSILMGGHVRVGLEDNLYYKRGRKFSGNGEAVERVVRISRELNREIATPMQAREILGLASAPRSY